jgi:putative colanic acid biosynthesis glycosyltransferase WcaI
VVAIGETMKQRLEDKGTPGDRITVIPNWVDTREITPQPRDNVWAREHGLVGAFVVMHSGNIGHAQDLDSLVRAATFLRDVERLRIVIAGFGARHGELTALARRLEVTGTLRFLPYQPRDVLAQSLSSADLHFVGLAHGLAGFVVPSRMYGILAAGRPVLVAADAESETVRIVREAECGIVLPPGRPELVAETIRDAIAGSYPLDAMGVRGRAYVEREADREIAFERYRRVVAESVASRSR